MLHKKLSRYCWLAGKSVRRFFPASQQYLLKKEKKPLLQAIPGVGCIRLHIRAVIGYGDQIMRSQRNTVESAIVLLSVGPDRPAAVQEKLGIETQVVKVLVPLGHELSEGKRFIRACWRLNMDYARSIMGMQPVVADDVAAGILGNAHILRNIF